MELLPKWDLSNNKPSFYDSESVTIIELASRLTGTINGMIDEYNTFAVAINEKLDNFLKATGEERTVFEIAIRQEFQDFIDVVNLKTNGGIPGLTEFYEIMAELERRITALEHGVEYSLPAYWDSYLDGKISTIKDLQKEGGRNCFSYLVLADMHYSQQKAHYTGKIARRIMEECGIKFALNLGDVVSRGSIVDYEASEREFDGFWSTVDPIKDRLLCTQGNHDGYYYNGSSNYYPIEKALDRVYSGMKLENPIVWDEYGTGYFVDDHANRVRYIMLNTCSRGSLEGECPSGIPYMSIFRYTQCQFDLVKKALTTIPNDRWCVVVTSHVVPIWEVDRFGDGVKVTDLEGTFTDASHMLNVLGAFVNRSSVSISHVDETGEWANVELSADFADAKGRLIVYNGGHYHVDKVWRPGETVNGDALLACPVIMHRCDSFNENQGSASEIETALETERVSGTPTEHCFDVVTVDVDGGMIYCTRIGAGEDRAISMNLAKIYSVTKNFTNVGIDFTGNSITHGDEFYVVLSASVGYTLDTESVSVTMGGVDITETAFDGDCDINIPSVTGDIVITATASKDVLYTNHADPASEEWVENGRLSQSGSSVSTLDGGIVTNYIPCKSGDIIRIKGMNPLWGDIACTANASAAWFADANKAKVGAIVLVSNIAEGALVRNDSDFDVEYTVGGYKSGATNNYLPSDMSVVAYMRFCGHITGSASDVIITVNEEII